MNENVLELQDVVVNYDGLTVLDVPHLAVYRGEILTLLGENGSGKTTLLRLLGLLIRPARGRVLFGGEEVDFGNARRLLELRRRMASVMQQPLLCRMTVRRNVALGLRFRGLPRHDIDSRVDAWITKLAISHLKDRPAAKLSGGEAQRTSLARAMVLDPEVLFLDEPFAALDAPTRQGQIQEFQSVLAESGVTSVFATHDRGEAIGLGDRVAVLMNGQAVQVGSAEAVFSRPERVEVARFVGIDTLFPGRITSLTEDAVTVDCGDISLLAEGDGVVGEEVCVAVRPEEIDLSLSRSLEAERGANVVAGRISRVMPAETHYRVEIECCARMVVVVSRVKYRELAFEIGQQVFATFKSRAAHLIRLGLE